MPRSQPRANGESRPTVAADPSLLDIDLKEWAGERIAVGGRKDALLGKVERLQVALDGRSIEGRVRGNRPLPYRVEVRAGEGAPTVECTCAGDSSRPCRHAVAALEVLRFPQPSPSMATPGSLPRAGAVGRAARGRGRIVQPATDVAGQVVVGGPERTLTREERLALAAAEERLNRRVASRREKWKVEPVGEKGGPSRFRVARGGETQAVTLRDPRGEVASCSCDDFAENELGTCRHVERVRTWILRKPKPPFVSLVSVWWQPLEWIEEAPSAMREIRVSLHDEPLPGSLKQHFDDAGRILPAPEGTAASCWAAEALDAVRHLAQETGCRLEVDAGLEARLQIARREEEQRARLRGISGEDPEWVAIRSRLGFKLHAYQEKGSLFLARRGRGFLADDMGLGKTVQAIAAALLLREVAGARRALIVCPASLKHQWRREIDKVCGEKAVVVEGSRKTRLAAYRDWTDGFLILNYELVLRDLDAIRDAAADLVVLDEAQRIKNQDTRTAREVKRLHSRFAFVLTGTPLENRLLELHSLAEFLYPRALGPRWRLVPFHAVTEPGGRILAYESLGILRSRLRDFFLRRERHAVLDQLPPRTDNTFWTGMAVKQRRVYRRQSARLATLLSNRGQLQPPEVRRMLQALTSMRILCNSLAQFDWPEHQERLAEDRLASPQEIRALNGPKLEEFARVLEDLLDESTTKIVVFSQWERMLRLAHFVVRAQLEQRDLRAEVFHGGLTSKARDETLLAFRDDPEVRVMFATDAGGLGLNLQESASIVVNLEVPWNPAVLAQRVGRVHRMGQRKSVQVLHFVTRGAVEERVRQVVESKRALFEGLLVDQAERVVFEENRGETFIERVRTLIGDADVDSSRRPSPSVPPPAAG